MNNIGRKVDLYLLSLALLFVFFIIISAKAPAANFNVKDMREWLVLAKENYLTILSFLALLYCVFAYFSFGYRLKGATDIPFEVTELENINYEHLTFLATYVVPLISFDFGSIRQVIVLSLLLVVMGIIYIKTDLFYANPSLALLGFHIYRANGSFKNGERGNIVLISRERIKENQKLSYIKLDEKIYYVKGV